MKTDCKVIDFPFEKRAYNDDPFCIFFVYCPYQNLILKGLYTEVNSFLKKNFDHYICKCTMWQNGKVRATTFSSSHTILVNKTKVKNRMIYKIQIFDKDKISKVLFLRNFPKRWIEEYNKADFKRNKYAS